MVYLVDTFLVGMDFNQEELEAISHRRFLYFGIGVILALDIALVALVGSTYL